VRIDCPEPPITQSVRATLINDRLDWNLLRTSLVIARGKGSATGVMSKPSLSKTILVMS
jgi:hypothetical protein